MAEAKKKTAKAKAVSEEVELKQEVQSGDSEESNTATTEAVEQREEVKTAKAGKRSTKALKEAEAKEAKEERKAEAVANEEKPKVVQKPARSRLERRGKGYRKSAELIDKTKAYTLAEALELATKTSSVKFDASVEMHIRLSVDPRQADQNIRDMVVLPAGTGRTVKIAVLADPEDAKKAKAAGADMAGSEEFLQQLEKGVIDFDILIATPAMMPKLGKYARLLGPKGLMPNPKSGTVAVDVAKAVTEAKAGRVEYRVDSTGIVHLGIGKVSFGKAPLLQNAEAVMASIRGNKPSSVKGTFVSTIYVTTAMGPSIPVQI